MDISSSGWDILLKLFGDIPGMLVHYFQRIVNIWYICQYFSWLTSLLKLDKCRNISRSGWYTFLEFFGDIPRMLVHYFQIILKFLYVCLPVHWLTSLLKLDKYRDISCSWWYISLKFLGGISGMFVHLYQIILKFLYGCQCVIWFTTLLKLHKFR